MRPHRLRLTAFGPFAETVEVDLDALTANGLFLLHGDTGAGKTTLLDGIGYALYGQVPGERNDARHLRSDHACLDLPTSVQLDVTLGGRRLRITRSPAQDKPSSRNRTTSGTTTVPAKVLLQELRAGQWHAVSTRIDEAGAEILDLMGMSADQFFQVVLLPQGDFARFLRASSKERVPVLQKLFATDRFRAVEDHLADLRRTTATQVETARHAALLLAARVAQAAGSAEPTVDMADEQWAAGLVAGVGREAAAAEQVAAAAQAERDGRQRTATKAARLADLQRRRTEALAASAKLTAAAPAKDQLRAELDAAGRAAEVAGTLVEADDRTAEAEAARRAAHRAREELAGALQAAPGLLATLCYPHASPVVPSVRRAADSAAGGGELTGDELASGELTGDELTGDELSGDELSGDELRVVAGAARSRLGRLDGLRQVERQLQQERAAAALAGKEAAAAERDVVTAEEGLAQLPARQEALSMRLAQARSAAIALPTAQGRCAALRSAAGTAHTLASTVALTLDLRDQLLSARETAVSLREKETELRRARFDSMIAELAFSLVDGDPCPVCGSADHPDPSELTDERVTREDEEHARSAAEAASREVERLTGQHGAAEAQASQLGLALTAGGHGGIDGDQLQRLAEAAQHEVDRLTALAAEEPAAAAELTALAAQQEQLAAQRLAAEGERSAATRRADDARRRAQGAAADLADELAGAADLAAAIAVTGTIAAGCDTAAEADAAWQRAEQEALRARERATRAATSVGFSDVAAAVMASRPVAWRDTAQAGLRSHADALAAVAATLAEPELDVPLDPPADVQGADRALRVADEALATAVRLAGTSQTRLRELQELIPELERALSALRPLEARHAEVRHLADLCAGSGANTLKMTLSSFVLAARLEEVAAAASVRLLRMSQGRYTLRHTDESRGAGRAGLGLLVGDAWTGQDRETSTLSGGETFLAALALALGLADVVTAESGGTRIDALFVDEGFGTLDADTLDEVMDVLDGLREGGRIVGLVSHVAELRARIPSQVLVRKGRTGSDLTVLGC